jgi:hypothetical protein
MGELALNRANCDSQWITPKQEEQGHPEIAKKRIYPQKYPP